MHLKKLDRVLNLRCHIVRIESVKFEYGVLSPGGGEDAGLEDGEGVEVGGGGPPDHRQAALPVVVAALNVVEIAVNPVHVSKKFHFLILIEENHN